MPNKNELLKDIAVALGATVTDKDNDTNELLALIRDNIGNAGGGSADDDSSKSSQLYIHNLIFKLGEYGGQPEESEGAIYYEFVYSFVSTRSERYDNLKQVLDDCSLGIYLNRPHVVGIGQKQFQLVSKYDPEYDSTYEELDSVTTGYEIGILTVRMDTDRNKWLELYIDGNNIVTAMLIDSQISNNINCLSEVFIGTNPPRLIK